MAKRIFLASASLAGALWATQAQAQAPGGPALTPEACRALTDLDLSDTIVQSAVPVAATATVPAFCRVKGYVRPAINFELHLPSTDWNGKYLQAGCGGYCGRMDKTSYFLEGKRRNYAVILTDTGHWGLTTGDARWTANNPSAFDDLSFRHIEEIARVGKAITLAYYHQDIRYSYFSGCSGGGRQGLTAATRYPDLFDGILAGAPSTDTGGLWAFFVNLTSVNRDAQGKPIFDPAKLPLIQSAVAKACGDTTGLVIDPFGCKFAAKAIQCPPGKSDVTCLTAAEVDVVDKWYAPPRLKSGQVLFMTGITPGSEPFWGPATMKPEEMFGFQRMSANRSFYSVYAQGAPTMPELDLERDYPTTMKSSQAQKLSYDLTKFRASKGKLIIYQGLADLVVNPGETAAYHKAASQQLGDNAPDTFRTFMVPGLGHCRNAPTVKSLGFNDTDFDGLTALENWVEKGIAPNQIVATKREADGNPSRSLPLCQFPQHAVYSGKGPRTDAANWRCEKGSA